MLRYVAAMNVPGGGKNDIPNRLKRHFAIFNVPQPSSAAINMIFGALIQVKFWALQDRKGRIDSQLTIWQEYATQDDKCPTVRDT